MPGFGQWLKPPRTLLLALFLLTLVAVSALAWLGRSLLDQERAVESQHEQDRQEQVADRIATKFREALAETGERLGYWILNPPADARFAEGVLLVVDGSSITVTPPSRLLYRPTPAPSRSEAPEESFAEAEALEFQQLLQLQAIDAYSRLAESVIPAVRAGALLRLARVSRKLGRVQESRAAYSRLATIGDVRIAGVPADLIARLAASDLSHDAVEAQRVKADLLNGRWSLSRGQFEFYWSESSRLSGSVSAPPQQATALSEAVSAGWEEVMREKGPSGQKAVWLGAAPWLLVWSGTPDRRAILAISPGELFRQVVAQEAVSCALADADGRMLLGGKIDTAHATVRTSAQTKLPWTLYVRATPGLMQAGMIARQRFLILITGLTMSFLIAGAYFIARAIRTEAAVARMQSDFVSAVSHEFRSPLTAMRQLSEMLATGRIPNEDRRHTYYETLVRETVRLQRLVEALLNFGRMEAGVRKFRFEETDAAGLVANVAAEFEPAAATAGRHIEVTNRGACSIHADPEALTVALRNLVDNAVKYAPESAVVWLECGLEDEMVAIRVRDKGPGIPASERKAIFRKFVRGSAAVAANVRGSGIGLAMVRHIVAAHHGRVTLDSEAGAGSTFTILLPRGAQSA